MFSGVIIYGVIGGDFQGAGIRRVEVPGHYRLYKNYGKQSMGHMVVD